MPRRRPERSARSAQPSPSAPALAHRRGGRRARQPHGQTEMIDTWRRGHRVGAVRAPRSSASAARARAGRSGCPARAPGTRRVTTGHGSTRRTRRGGRSPALARPGRCRSAPRGIVDLSRRRGDAHLRQRGDRPAREPRGGPASRAARGWRAKSSRGRVDASRQRAPRGRRPRRGRPSRALRMLGGSAARPRRAARLLWSGGRRSWTLDQTIAD